MKKGIGTAVLLITSLLLLTGCWDSRDIDKNSFIIGIAIDKGKEPQFERDADKHGGRYRKKNIITMTRQIILPSSSKSSDTSGGGKRSYRNTSISGDSFHQILREFALENRNIIASHMKVLVISKAIAEKVRLDFMLNQAVRDNEIRNSTVIFMSRGEARLALSGKAEENTPSEYLLEIADNRNRTTRLLPQMTLQKVASKMASGSSFLLPAVYAEQERVKMIGAAVIKGSTRKAIGFLGEEEVEGMTWLTGKGARGVVKSLGDQNQLVVYEISSMKGKIIPHVEGDDITFDVQVKSIGAVSEDWSFPGDAFENSFLKKVEQSTEKEIRRMVNQTIQSIQKKYKVDVGGFGEELRIAYPKVWKKVKANWDETFSKAKINYNVNITVNAYGNQGKK
ncbi:Ger(x)C family spore germination protein [Brevibacillus fluminis]|uniref:Ger(x)C family spore germination protein n=1 Tax=Brevibacillus fluminis TaxID=511487 RepID=UPI001FE2A988|nr:Ger(x)C family spore germination protein [Brevibacillus fluminis]